MTIYMPTFPIYPVMIVLALVLGCLYILYYLRQKKVGFEFILLYYMMYVSFALVFGKLYTMVAQPGEDFFKVGLSAYGGLIGTVLAAIIYEFIVPTEGSTLKATVISLPLVYAITKVGCHFAGCCGGLPYKGRFHVLYPDGQSIPQFPIQITETAVFLLIFFICHLFRHKKYIEYVTLILVAVFKLLLDYLRYDHQSVSFTFNQKFSLVLLVITIMAAVISGTKARCKS